MRKNLVCSDEECVRNLLRRAESILEVASSPDADPAETVLVLDRAGQLRVLNAEGWSLPGLIQEFGAAEVYVVRRCAGRISVEGWSPTDQCTITQKQSRPVYRDSVQPRLSGYTSGYIETSQVRPQLAV